MSADGACDKGSCCKEQVLQCSAFGAEAREFMCRPAGTSGRFILRARLVAGANASGLMRCWTYAPARASRPANVSVRRPCVDPFTNLVGLYVVLMAPRLASPRPAPPRLALVSGVSRCVAAYPFALLAISHARPEGELWSLRTAHTNAVRRRHVSAVRTGMGAAWPSDVER